MLRQCLHQPWFKAPQACGQHKWLSTTTSATTEVVAFWRRMWQTDDDPDFHIPAVNPNLRLYHKQWTQGLPAAAAASATSSSSASHRRGHCGRVLVTCCGKSVDMAHLAREGHDVVGIDIAVEAAEAVRRTQVTDLEPTPPPLDAPWIQHTYKSSALPLTFVVGDMLQAQPGHLGAPFDLVWDRGGITSFPPSHWPHYLHVLASLMHLHGRVLMEFLDSSEGEHSPLLAAVQTSPHFEAQALAQRNVTAEYPYAPYDVLYEHVMLLTHK